MTPLSALLRQLEPTPEEQWIAEKRDEAQRLHRHNHREWIKAGAVPAPRYGVIA